MQNSLKDEGEEIEIRKIGIFGELPVVDYKLRVKQYNFILHNQMHSNTDNETNRIQQLELTRANLNCVALKEVTKDTCT